MSILVLIIAAVGLLLVCVLLAGANFAETNGGNVTFNVLFFMAIILIVFSAVSGIVLRIQDTPASSTKYACLKNEFGSYVTTGDKTVSVSYIDDDGDIRFIDVKDAKKRADLEAGADPYVEVREYKFLFVTTTEKVAHINLGYAKD